MNIQVLDNRLTAVSRLIRTGNTVADIGCDHGKLAVFLVQTDIAKKVIAIDVNQAPLNKAVKKVATLNLMDKIECRLGDGLLALSECEAQDIVIAGMSGVTISDIINAVEWSKNTDLRFVLVPASKADYLRNWLCENGFTIKEEVPVEAKGRFYPVLAVEYTGQVFTPTQEFLALGLIKGNESAEAKGYKNKVIKQLQKELKGKKIDARYTQTDIDEIKNLIEKIKL